MKNKLILLTVVTAILLSSIFFFGEAPIRDATYEELLNINGIGEILANRISEYLELHPEATIQDLGNIDGIGEVKLKLLYESWCD